MIPRASQETVAITLTADFTVFAFETPSLSKTYCFPFSLECSGVSIFRPQLNTLLFMPYFHYKRKGGGGGRPNYSVLAHCLLKIFCKILYLPLFLKIKESFLSKFTLKIFKVRSKNAVERTKETNFV